MTFRRRELRLIHYCALVGVLVSAKTALAQTTPPTNPVLARTIDQERGLDVRALIALAQEHSPNLARAEAVIQTAIGRERQASLRSNPELSIERREQLGGTDVATGIGATWALDVGRIQPRKDAAAAGRAAVEEDRDDARRLLFSAVRMAYGELLAAAERLRTTESQIETATSLLRLATERAAAGSGATLEREQLAVEVSLLTRQRLRDELQVETRRLALSELVGLAASDALLVKGSLQGAVEELTSHDTPNSRGIRSDVRAAIARVTAAQARTRSAQAEGRLNIGVFGQFMSTRNSFPQQGFSATGALVPIAGTFNMLSGGVSFMLPWLNRQQGEIAASTAEAAVASRELDRTRLAADYEVAIDRLRVTKAREAVTLLRDEALTRVQANLDVVREAYSLGARPLSDVLAEIRRVQQIQLELNGAWLELYQANVDLRTALGDIE